MSLLTKPSILSHIINGLLLFIVIILMYKNNLITGTNIDSLAYVNLLLILSIAIGIHGLLHLGLEMKYNYNPLEKSFT